MRNIYNEQISVHCAAQSRREYWNCQYSQIQPTWLAFALRRDHVICPPIQTPLAFPKAKGSYSKTAQVKILWKLIESISMNVWPMWKIHLDLSDQDAREVKNLLEGLIGLVPSAPNSLVVNVSASVSQVLIHHSLQLRTSLNSNSIKYREKCQQDCVLNLLPFNVSIIGSSLEGLIGLVPSVPNSLVVNVTLRK
jgi:hypothetical protein